MKHYFDAVACMCALLRVSQITLNELHPLEPSQVIAFARDEVINAANAFSALQQCCSNRTANESGSPGYKIFRQPYPPDFS
jgi:hypothetical protein